MRKNKLGVRELINVALFSVIIIIVSFVAGMIGFIPVLMPLMLFIQGVVIGPISMLYATKIKCPGMILIQYLLISLVFLATGHGPWMIIVAVVVSLFAEVVLKGGGYTSIKHARYAFTLTNICFAGNFVPIIINKQYYLLQLKERGFNTDYIATFDKVLPIWGLVPIVILGLIGAYIGCSLGIAMLKKHFERAGMV